MAAAGDPMLVRRMSSAIQRILDVLSTNLVLKSKGYKSKVHAVFDEPLMHCGPCTFGCYQHSETIPCVQHLTVDIMSTSERDGADCCGPLAALFL